MGDDRPEQQTDPDATLEREVRLGRKFSAREAMARMAGPGAMKGASPVSPVQQAETEIANWLECFLADDGEALPVVLQRRLKGSQLVLDNLDRPLAALALFCHRILQSDDRLKELVRDADAEWGRAMGERPHFDREGAPPHPDDPYSLEAVRAALEVALAELSGLEGGQIATP